MNILLWPHVESISCEIKVYSNPDSTFIKVTYIKRVENGHYLQEILLYASTVMSAIDFFLRIKLEVYFIIKFLTF